MGVVVSGSLKDLMESLPRMLKAGVEVAQVQVTDRVPCGSDHRGYKWFANLLPAEIYDRLAGPESSSGDGKLYMRFEDAQAALQAKLLEWARGQS